MKSLIPSLEARLNTVGAVVLRYSLVLFFIGYGLYKFTPQEAAAIQPLMANSVLLSWLYHFLSVGQASGLIGVIEITTGLLIAMRAFKPTLSAIGSLAAAFALLNTLSFLVTTPGLDPQGADVGFLVKDLTLLGAALWTAGEAFAAARGAKAPVART